MANPLALVTGAHGFIGRHVARQIAQDGYSVGGLGHGVWSRSEWSDCGLADWRACDITLENLQAYAGQPELIVHCAGSGSVGFSVRHPAQDFARSVSTLLATLEFCRQEAPACRIVFLSSAAVYGQATHLPTPESASPAPVSPYGTHKLIGEQLCRSYSQQFGLRVAVVRLFSVYGPGLRKQLLWDACTKLSKRDSEFAGDGSEIRDWLHVADAVTLILRAAQRAAPDCPTVNGGTGEGVAVREVLTTIVERLAGGGGVHFTGQGRGGDPRCYQADTTLAHRWGWTPARNWRDGIIEYVDWFRRGAP